MKFNKLNDIEAFCEQGCGGVFTHTPLILKAKTKSVSVFKTVRKNAKAYTIPSPTTPKRIVLHFTGGALEGDLMSLTGNRGTVSVPFLIARSGKIFNLFNPDTNWSYHLGIGATGGNGVQSRQTIGIEISNYGPLFLSGDGKSLLDAYKGTYCLVSDESAYVKLDKPYRGVSYFARFTEAQYSSLNQLIGYLCERYNISRTFLPEAERSNHLPNIDGAPGILCHTNFKTDKLDFPPTQFEWSKIQ